MIFLMKFTGDTDYATGNIMSHNDPELVRIWWGHKGQPHAVQPGLNFEAIPISPIQFGIPGINVG